MTNRKPDDLEFAETIVMPNADAPSASEEETRELPALTPEEIERMMRSEKK